MGSQHTAQIARLIDNNLGRETLLFKSLTCFTHQTGYLPISGRRTFLLGAEPVPVTIRLVNRTEIIKMDAIVFLDALYSRSHKLCKIIVTIVLQIDGTATTSIGG